ncbi:MAG: glycosyltransferase [Solirubrobacteraceae bacterium]
MNQNSTMTVRELARERTVLFLNRDFGGSLLSVLQGRGRSVQAAGLARIAFGGMRPRRVEERLWVAPLRGPVAYAPLAYPELLRRYAVRVLTRVIRGWLHDRGEDACLLLFYWPELPELARTVPCAASAYDCTDDHATMPGRLVPARRVRALEQRLLDEVDRTWVVSPGLLEGRDDGRRVEVAASPIDLRLFRRIAEEPPMALPELRGRTGPVVGYAGGLTERIDWALLEQIVERRPEWTLLLVGHDPAAAPRALHLRENVVFTGSLPYDGALRAIARFDVGIIPVRSGAFSHGNSFLKLGDYLAAGLPVVASEVPDTAAAAARAPGAIAVATGADAWLAALDAAITRTTTDAVRRARQLLLAERDNARRVARLLAALEEDRVARAQGA